MCFKVDGVQNGYLPSCCFAHKKSDYLIGRIDTPVPESTVVGNLISELTTEEVIYLVSILSRYVEILKKAGTDRNENSSV